MGLSVEVFVSSQVATDPATALPFTGPVKWSPISSTLVLGEMEAILVDTPITIAQNEALAVWVNSKLKGRTLKGIYITHGHADHFLGIGIFQKQFRGCQVYATTGTKQHMKDQLDPVAYNATWATYFPDSLPELTVDDIDAVEAVTAEEFSLEGSSLQAIELGHTDTHSSTALYVPEIALVICGDSVYGDVHCMLRWANTKEKRQEWIDAVKKIKSLSPRIVVAGHKRQDGEDTPSLLDSTIEYIDDFQKGVESGVRNSRELFDWMMKRHGARLNPAALEVGCHAAFPAPSS